MRREYASNIYMCRNLVLMPGMLEKGVKIKDAQVLKGQPYDYLMWIDSDAVFKPEHLWMLVKHDVDIASGQAIINFQERKLNWGMNGSAGTCDFAHKDMLEIYERDAKGLVSVDFVGFHWMLVKHGVFEKLDYPWFSPVTKKVGENIYYPSEDIGWCMKAKEAGFKIMVDTDCKIGHEKQLVMPS
jgi:GT2 family glycosyltransferase